MRKNTFGFAIGMTVLIVSTLLVLAGCAGAEPATVATATQQATSTQQATQQPTATATAIPEPTYEGSIIVEPHATGCLGCQMYTVALNYTGSEGCVWSILKHPSRHAPVFYFTPDNCGLPSNIGIIWSTNLSTAKVRDGIRDVAEINVFYTDSTHQMIEYKPLPNE